MIKSEKLSKFKQIRHGFFDRKGGKSEGIYESLNCGKGSLDNKNNVIVGGLSYGGANLLKASLDERFQNNKPKIQKSN